MNNNYKAKKMTGDFQFPVNSKNEFVPTNVEVEKGEWIQKDSGKTKLIEGSKHSKGGTDILMKDGDKVLTDFSKVPKFLAKDLGNDYGLKLSDKDTFSTILDKYSKKIGLEALTNEEIIYNKRLIDNGNTRDESTRELNNRVLTEKITSIKKSKEPLEKQRSELFDTLFEYQEFLKEDKKDKDFFQSGGMINNTPFSISQRFPTYRNKELWRKQSAIDANSGMYGDNLVNKDLVLNEMSQLHPNNFSDNLKDINPDNIKNYQRQMNTDRTNRSNNLSNILGQESQLFKDFSQYNSAEMFTEDDSVTGIEGKLGNYTSDKAADVLNIIDPAIYSSFKEDNIRSIRDLKNSGKYPDIASNLADFDDSWLLGEYITPITTLSNNEVPSSITEDPIADIPGEVAPINSKLKDYLSKLNIDNNSLNVMRMPDRTPMRPGTVAPHLKTSPELNEIRSQTFDSNSDLKELNRNRIATENALSNQDFQTRNLAILANSGKLQESIEKVIGRTQNLNAQNTARDMLYNTQAKDRYNQELNNSALNYEQRALTAEGMKDAEERRYNQALIKNRVQDWNTINKLNAYNAMNPDVQIRDGVITTRKSKLFNPYSNLPVKEADRKERIRNRKTIK